MTPTVYTRLLDDLVAELGLIVPAPGLVSTQLRDWTTLEPTKFPAVFVELSSDGDQPPDRQERGRVHEELSVDFWGVVNTAQGAGTDRQHERESWLGLVFNRLTADAMQQRLTTTFKNAGGKGALSLRPDGPAARDEGYGAAAAMPYGVFRLPMLATMTYPRGGM